MILLKHLFSVQSACYSGLKELRDFTRLIFFSVFSKIMTLLEIFQVLNILYIDHKTEILTNKSSKVILIKLYLILPSHLPAGLWSPVSEGRLLLTISRRSVVVVLSSLGCVAQDFVSLRNFLKFRFSFKLRERNNLKSLTVCVNLKQQAAHCTHLCTLMNWNVISKFLYPLDSKLNISIFNIVILQFVNLNWLDNKKYLNEGEKTLRMKLNWTIFHWNSKL